MKKMLSFFRSHPKTTLLLFIIITALIVYHRYFFGGDVFLFEDIGSDTKQQYIAWYNSIAYHLNQGDFSFWDATYGFGTPLFTLNLFHPTLGVLYLIGAVFGGSSIAGALIYVHLLHLVLAGIGCWLFLSSFKLSKRSVFIFSYIYSFNGYLVMWGQHYHFAIFIFYLPLLLCLIERSLCIFSKVSAFKGEEALKQRKRALLIMPLVTGVMLLTGYYMSYMIALICALYMIIRFILLKIRPAGTMLKAFFGRAALMLLGAGIGMIYVLPSYTVIAESSSRLAGGSILERIVSALAPWPKEYYMSFLKKMCSSGLEGIGTTPSDYLGYANVYEAPNVFLTGLFLILIVQFIIFLPRIAKTARARIAVVISLILTAAICFVPAASLVFNGFAYPFARHLFVVLPLMCLMCAVTLDHILKNRCFSVIGALISILFVGFFCIRGAMYPIDRFLKVSALSIFITTFIAAVVLLFFKRGRIASKRTVTAALCIIAVVQVVSNTYTTVYSRASVSFDSSYLEDIYGEDDRELDEYLSEHEDEFYRLEKTYSVGSETMDSLLQNYRGISGYNSTMNKYVIEFTDIVAPEFRTGPNPYWLTFKNLSGRSTLCSLFGIKYIVTEEEGGLPEGYEEAAVCGDTYLYEYPQMTFAHYYTETISEEAYEQAREYMDGDEILADYLILNDEPDCAINDASDGIPDISSPLYDGTGAVIRMPESGNDGYMEIYVESDKDGYLFIPVTFEKGWKAYVDGTETDILRADYGFMAVRMQKGSHSVRLEYTAPYLYVSAAATLISLAVYILFVILFLMRERKKGNVML